MNLYPCSRQGHGMDMPCAGEEEVAADYHQHRNGSSQMPGQMEETIDTVLLGHYNGTGRAE